MYITADTIIKAAALFGALGALGAVACKAIRWFQSHEKQSSDIDTLKNKESEDISEIKDELCLLTYGLLACLDGLKQLGANGTVTEMRDKIEKRLNKQAHNLK